MKRRTIYLTLASHLSFTFFGAFFVGLLIGEGSATAAPAKAKKVTAPVIEAAAVPTLQISQAVTEPQGVLKITNTITCDNATSSACAQICQASSCEWTEPLCRDCFGTGLEVMREIFERLSTSHRVVQTIDDAKLAHWLTARSMILVSTTSPYDYYGSSESPGIASHLQALCGSDKGFVAVLLDEDQRPTQAVLAICSSVTGLKANVLGRRYGDIQADSVEIRKPI